MSDCTKPYNPAEEQGLGTFLKSMNPLRLTSSIYHLRYFLWSIFIAFIIVQFAMPGWHTMSWASFAFLTLCFYLIFTATPLLQASPYFIPAISPYPSTLGLDGISHEVRMAGQ